MADTPLGEIVMTDGASPKQVAGRAELGVRPMTHALFHEVSERYEQLRDDHRDHHPGDDYCDSCQVDWPCNAEVALRRVAMVEAELATLASMVEKAASTLRELADLEGDDGVGLDPDAIRSMARRTLKAMREIGGFDR